MDFCLSASNWKLTHCGLLSVTVAHTSYSQNYPLTFQLNIMIIIHHEHRCAVQCHAESSTFYKYEMSTLLVLCRSHWLTPKQTICKQQMKSSSWVQLHLLSLDQQGDLRLHFQVFLGHLAVLLKHSHGLFGVGTGSERLEINSACYPSSKPCARASLQNVFISAGSIV